MTSERSSETFEGFESVTVDSPEPAPGTILLAGIPGSGKSTVAAALAARRASTCSD